MNNLLRHQGAFHHFASTNKTSARNIPKLKVVPFSNSTFAFQKLS